jgi:hypothetical protein
LAHAEGAIKRVVRAAVGLFGLWREVVAVVLKIGVVVWDDNSEEAVVRDMISFLIELISPMHSFF